MGVRQVRRLMVVLAGAGAFLPALAAPAPAQTILAPEGEAVTYGANPSRTGEAKETDVFGPLFEEWVADLGGLTQQPLVSAGALFVITDEGSLSALDPTSGATIWQQATAGGSIAVDSGVVVALSSGGGLSAYAAADGTPLWQVDAPIKSATPPVADAGVVYVYGGDRDDPGDSRAYAYNLSDGSPVWSDGGLLGLRPSIGFRPGGTGPALDDSRLYLTTVDGGGIALDRADGSVIWERESAAVPSTAARTLLAGDTVLSGRGPSFAAADGSSGPELVHPPLAAGQGLSFDLGADGFELVTAAEIATGQEAWFEDVDARELDDLLLVGPTLYAFGGRDLVTLAPTSGDTLFRQTVDEASISRSDRAGITAAADRLFIAEGSRIRALRPLLQPQPTGTDIAASASDININKRVSFLAGLGRGYLGAFPEARWEVDPAPFNGNYKRFATPALKEDGTAQIRRRIKINSRVRLAVDGGESPFFQVRAYPKYNLNIRQTSGKRGRIKGTVKGIAPKKIRKLKMFAYFGDASKRRYKRLGSGRIRKGGKQKAVAKIGFKLLPAGKVKRKDVVAICVRKLGKRYGRNTGLQKRCGSRKVRYPKGNRAAQRRAPAAGEHQPLLPGPGDRADAPGAPSVPAGAAGAGR